MLEPILHQEFWIVRSNGVRQDKEQMLEGLASAAEGRRKIRKELLEPYGGDSIVALTLINYYHGDNFVGDFWNTKVFVKEGGTWWCKVWQVAPVSHSISRLHRP